MIPQTFNFQVPDDLNASHPPERRGIRRDHAKLLILNKNTKITSHDYFYHIDQYLHEGDLLVLNNSRTVPAVLQGVQLKNGKEAEVRLARKKADNLWDVLPAVEDLKVGDIIMFSEKLTGEIVGEQKNQPIKTMQFNKSGMELYEEIYTLGEPIRYEYIKDHWGLEYYQTVFASQPGSVEMPSAGRAFTWEMLFDLKRKGINIAFLQLHTGLSYLLDDKWDHSPSLHEESYEIPISTLQQVEETKQRGNRVIAVGTTVVRALETFGITKEASGWTNLHIKRNFPLKIADGILTGLHEPEASHLELLSAFVEEEILIKAYEEALTELYLWHEFGDMNLIL